MWVALSVLVGLSLVAMLVAGWPSGRLLGTTLAWALPGLSMVTAVVCGIVAWRAHRRAAAARAITDGAIGLHTDALDKTKEFSEILAGAVSEATEARARADRYFNVIRNIERERDEWREIYHASVAGAQNAQELLMGEIARLLFELKRANKKAELSPKIKAVVEEFRAEFSGSEARAPAGIKPAEGLLADVEFAKLPEGPT